MGAYPLAAEKMELHNRQLACLPIVLVQYIKRCPVSTGLVQESKTRYGLATPFREENSEE